ncbi:MAG: histone [Candidatus Njordarchaeia archaeon]
MTDLHLSGIRRLAKKGGAERISKDALEYLLNATEKIVEVIAKKANAYAAEKNRITVSKSDIKIALKDILKDPSSILGE